MFTYFLYNVILITAACFAYLAEHGDIRFFRNISRGVVFLTLWLPAALRHNTGTDYFAYVGIFQENFSMMSNIEPGWRFLNFIVRSLGLSAQWIFVTSAFLIYFPICFVLKRKDYFYGILFYILLFFYLRSYNTIRQAISVSFIVCAVIYFQDKKYAKLVIYMILALIFHGSTLLIVPFFAVKLIKYKKRITAVMLTVVGMVFLYYVDVLTIIFFILKILNSKYYRYASYLAGETFHLHGGTIFTFFAIMVRSSLLFLAIFLMPSIVKKDKEKLFLINMAIIYNYINIIGLRYIIINRVRELFSFVPILISGSAFSVRGKYRKIIVCLIIILNIGLFEITIYNNNRERIGSSVYPYYSIFSKDR